MNVVQQFAVTLLFGFLLVLGALGALGALFADAANTAQALRYLD